MKRTQEEEERKNNVLALLYTALVCAVIFFICAFTIVWEAPDPPIPEYGMEMDFGFDEVGSDDFESETDNEPIEDAETEQQEEEVFEEVEEPVQNEEIVDNSHIEESIDSELEEVIEEETDYSEVDPVTDVEEEVTTKEINENTDQDNENEKVVEKETTPVEQKPKIDTRTLLGNNNQSKNKNNNGNGDEVGNTGNTDQQVDERTILTNTTRKAPVQLDLPGWQWTSVPDKKDSSSEIGVVKIGFTIDSHGEVISSNIKYTDLSIDVARFYQKLVDELEFQRTGTSNVQHSAFQYGSITFNIIAK